MIPSKEPGCLLEALRGDCWVSPVLFFFWSLAARDRACFLGLGTWGGEAAPRGRFGDQIPLSPALFPSSSQRAVHDLAAFFTPLPRGLPADATSRPRGAFIPLPLSSSSSTCSPRRP